MDTQVEAEGDWRLCPQSVEAAATQLSHIAPGAPVLLVPTKTQKSLFLCEKPQFKKC